MTASHLSRREFIRLGTAAASGAALLAACSNGSGTSSSTGPVTIKFWNSTYETTDSNDKTKKKEQFYIYQAVQRFEAANPNIKVDIQIHPATTDMFTQYRVASIAKNGPDVMTLWSGSYMLQLKRFLEPLDSYFTSQERSRIQGWNAVTEGFKEGAGKTYGVPNTSDGITAIYYNKSILSKAGINPEASWPKNFDEFLAMLDKLKATGTTPLALYDNGYTFFSLDYWLAQMVNGDPGIGDLVAGKRNFSDPQLVDVIQKWSKLAQYTVSGAPTMDSGQASQFFYQGKAAMTVNGPWPLVDMRKALGNNLGIHKLPDFSASAPIQNSGVGGVGTALIISNYSKHKEESIKFIKFLMSQPEQTKRAQDTSGNLINTTDVDVTKIYQEPYKVQIQKWVLEPNTIFWPDNIFPADLASEISAQAQLAWTGKISPQQFMSKLDAKRDEVLKAPQQ